MIVALIQMKSSEDRTKNRMRGLEMAKEAVSRGSKIICFSELAFEPFYPQTPATQEKLNLAEPIPGSTTKLFSELAAENEVVIILNLFEKDGDNTYDSSPVINSDGNLMGVTRMVHITDYPCFHEKGYYTPGDTGIRIYDTRYGKIGVAICYDRHYPEYMRALGLEGAEIVFIPQAGAVDEWPEGVYESEVQTASFQNGYFTALCNRVGKESELTFAGESFVCNPEGKVIARAAKEKEEILYCDIDLSQVSKSAARRLFYRDRRPELYKKWF